MTKNDIIRMAKEAGLRQRFNTPAEWWCWEGSIERFAVIVAEAEREACAKKWIETHGFDKHGVAEFIRSRGST